MDHNQDFDRDGSLDDAIDQEGLSKILQANLEKENDLMRTYIHLAERINDNEQLKDRLENFAQGNAKRTMQLQDELNNMKKS
ncbi:tRNA isopentenyl-2-thiomethyl-A-37 hydroxylase MiaE [Bacillus mesophilus]|uniref:Uncharacterized protein n=1 Tax=Bacillus mesophilus TaxID=1808955 RepID=A0A6M0QBT9_9BACI|nr:hypothetical protein [Bacillus mesophilus]MBM7660142.1 tRNA isopentenyl-2-thiomethyl-A-37 hydroxylase MiaE [Bacillus mesophilus]NEY73795.1 hypothetical protein [Bacillus mesophilus]